MKIGILLFLLAIPACFSQDQLEFKAEADLQILLKEEKYLIILFSDKEVCTDICKNLQDTLYSIREELVEETGGWVIWTYSPQINKELHVTKPTVLFYREGRPLIYTGSSTNDEELLTYLTENKVPSAHNLTDSTFEHQTQAGSGATTGDWLVLFTKDNCDDCTSMVPVMEAVGASVKGKKNVAIVEREHGGATARRFGVKQFPFFILFRQGKLYRYSYPVFDIASLSSFALEGFRNAKAESVPNPKSPFDDLTEACVDWLKENPITFLMCTVGILAVIAFIVLLNMPVPQSWAKKSKDKKRR